MGPERESFGETGPENQEIEGTDLQKQAWGLEDQLSENSAQRHEAWTRYSQNKSDESLRQAYEDLEAQKRQMELELSRVHDAMGEREYFDCEIKMARPKKLVNDPEFAQQIANSVKGLRNRSRELLAQAEELSKNPDKQKTPYQARILTHRALILEFQAGQREERMIAGQRK